MKIKLCGFTDEISIKAAIAGGCDFLGFIFFEKSLRFVTSKNAAIISKEVPKNISKVAVVVDASDDLIDEIVADFSPDFFQFHGKETPEFLTKFRQKFPQIKIIKAFKIKEKLDLEVTKSFENCSDFFLFDGASAGSGEKFDWKILSDFSCEKNWFLSGGLNLENIDEAIKITGANMIDLSSGIEEIRGKKSPKLITEFLEKFKKATS